MSERMKRLSQKKEEKKRKSTIMETYEHSSEVSSNVDRDGMTAYSSPDKHANTFMSSNVAYG